MLGLSDDFASNFIDNLKGYEFRDYLRIVIIIGGYVLFRKHFVTWRTNRYKKHQDEEDERLREEAKEEAKQAALKKLDTKASGAEWGWGSTAKDNFTKRRKYIQNQARRKAEMLDNEEDSDEDIKEFLQH